MSYEHTYDNLNPDVPEFVPVTVTSSRPSTEDEEEEEEEEEMDDDDLSDAEEMMENLHIESG